MLPERAGPVEGWRSHVVPALAILLTLSACVCQGLAIGAWSVDRDLAVRPVVLLGCAFGAMAVLLAM